MNKKIILTMVATAILAFGNPTGAQQPAKVPRIGWLAAGSASGVAPLTDAFRQGLRQLGYVEGKNIVIEFRYAEGKFDRLPDLAAEIVHLKVDVIVVASTPATGNTALALFEAKPKNPRIFYKPSCSWYDYCRGISRFIDQI